jgi:hypothetical protein
MSYESVDALQQVLVETVFHYAGDRKKAAGRALGTLVEIITYYALKGWGFRENVAIERPLAEYGNPAITHNVEFSLHPILRQQIIPLQPFTLPLTAAKLHQALDKLGLSREGFIAKAARVLDNQGRLTNACTFSESETAFCIASVDEISGEQYGLTTSVLHSHPFAIFECKRVGVEEGMKKGPQSIEKAKQGAYVARSVSSLQKVRYRNGQIGGVIQLPNGAFYHKPYTQLMDETINSDDPAMLRHFILTVGVVSNHGNWFTAEDHNKELRVLAQSYDWLLFLTDKGLAQFVEELLLDPKADLEPARVAFLSSYPKSSSGKNRFTKVNIDVKADLVLRKYFQENSTKIEDWFNVISPAGKRLKELRDELQILNAKNWARILSP